jgi:hypothetical protein
MLRLLVSGALLCIAAMAVLAWALTDGAPQLDTQPPMSAATAERVLQRLSAHDPRGLRSGEQRTLELAGDELQALLQSAARRLPRTRARSLLTDGSLSIRTSTRLPAGRWLNAELTLEAAAGEPRIAALRLGAVNLPGALARPLIAAAAPYALRQTGYTGDPAQLTGALRDVRISPAKIALDYTWSPDILDEGIRTMLPAGEVERLAAYHDALQRAVGALQTQGDNDLLPALQHLFALAQTRSGTPQDEQRSAVLALALYINGRTPADLLPEASGWPRIARHTLTLRGREDLAQHYIGSALLALYAGAQWADAIGLSKEVRDSKRGSGFSFTDLLADRAGTRLGEQILAGRGDVAHRLADGIEVDALLPPVDGLAEFLPEAEFRRRFGGVGAPAYTAVIDDIEARIAALDLYQ